MRSIGLVIVIVVVAAWAMLRREPTIASDADAAVNPPAARLQEVRSVSFDGHKLLSARLRQVLETRPGSPLDTARLERDRSAMERMLADVGYLAARVAPAAVTFDPAGAAYITFDIDQGPMFHLRNIEISGAAKDLTVVTLAAGDDAIRSRIERARQGLIEGLARRGRPASVELSVHTDVAAAAVDVTFATR